MGRHGRGHGGGGAHLAELATLLGLDASELRDQLVAGSTLAEVAEAQGVDTEVLVDAMTAQLDEHLDAAVAAGRIDQDTADTKLAAGEERFRDRLDDEITPGSRGRGGFGGRGALKAHVDELADSLGLDLDALRDAVVGGQTVAEAAEAQGVGSEELSAALTEAARERIAEAVENGRIDEDRAAELEAQIADRVDAMINGSLGDGFGRGFGGRHHGGPGRFGPDTDTDTDTDTGADGETQESSYTA